MAAVVTKQQLLKRWIIIDRPLLTLDSNMNSLFMIFGFNVFMFWNRV